MTAGMLAWMPIECVMTPLASRIGVRFSRLIHSSHSRLFRPINSLAALPTIRASAGFR